MTSVSVAVVGHVARQDQAHRLTRQLGGRLFLDNGELGEVENHRRAWTWAATQPTPWVAVLQDDAVPIPDMPRILAEGIGHLPAPGLISCYLGTSYPTQWQRAIRRALAEADRTGAAWLISEHLLHGVAVTAPTNWAHTINEHLTSVDPSEPYDELLTDLAQQHDWPVYYPVPSLVDHDDGPTLVDHPDGRGRTKPRHAWRTGAPNWNERAVRL